MITVTGDRLDDLRRQIGLDKPLILTIKPRPGKFDPGNFMRGTIPQTGCIVEVEGAEVPRMFETASEALCFIATILEDRDREIRKHVERESPP